MTKTRPSRALWRSVQIQFSPLSQVGARRMSMPWAYIAYLASGMYCSQQVRAPTRPNGVSKAARVEPSPMPQTRRSPPVGISLRWRPTISPSGEKDSSVL